MLFFIAVESSHIDKYLSGTSELQLFLMATAILGCLCSWLATYFWNWGCSLVPISLGGQLTIFETIFGLFFVYLFEKRLPSSFEFAGIAIMLLAVLYSMHTFNLEMETS